MTTVRFANRIVLKVLMITAVILISSLAALAQSTTADLFGTVTDPSGAVVPGATVTATNLATGAVTSAVSEANGDFSLRLLPPGRYTVKAELQGFKAWVIPEVTLAVGDRVRLTPRLEVGQLQETIEVTGVMPALQTQTSNLGTLISNAAIDSLPVSARNFVNLLVLTAGATSDEVGTAIGGVTDHRQSTAVTINGFGGGSNNFLLDGIDDNERFDAIVIIRPSMDAIQELKVETNKYSADFGRTSGGVVNIITKSGTNDFHGSLFEFLHNDALDARNFFAKAGVTPKPPWKQNMFGASLGGPIVKNRTFFFIDYQGMRTRYGLVSTVSVPTDANRAGRFTQTIYDPLTTRVNPANPATFIRDPFPAVGGVTDISNFINPVSRNVLSLWPEPNGGTATNPNFTQTATRPQRDDRGDLRVDQRIGSGDSVFARYSINDVFTFSPSQLPVVNGINPGGGSQPGPSYTRAQAMGLGYIHVFNQRLVMELKAGYNRYASYSYPPNWGSNASAKLGMQGVNQDLMTSALAQIAVSGQATLGDASYIPTFDKNNIYLTQGSISYVRSSHNIRIGGAYVVRQVLMYQSNVPVANFAFDSTATYNPSTGSGGNAFATFLLGYPTQTQRNVYLVEPLYSVHEFAWFAQDDWRATSKLTFNLGLRYDYYSPLTERYNRLSNVDLVAGQFLIAGQNGVSRTANINKDLNNYQPRVGFAAIIFADTVLRGGYGVSFVPGSLNTPLALRNPPFVNLLAEAYAPASYLTAPLPTRSLSTPLPALLPATTDRKLVTGNLAPVDTNYPIPYTQQINLSLQHQFPAGFAVTAGYVGQLARKLKGTVNVNQLNPGETVRPYAAMFPMVGNGSITPTASRLLSNYNSLQVVVERRFSNGFLLQSNYVWAHLLSTAPAQARAQLEKSNAGLGVNHHFSFSGTYDLPFPKKAPAFLRAVGTGWRANGILLMHTGSWLTVSNSSTRTGFVSTSQTGGGGGIADRPDTIANPNTGPKTIAQWFNTAAFVGQALGTYGNTGGGTVQGPGSIVLNFSLAKSFTIKEGIALAFRFEAFNILNHPNFGSPNVLLGSAAFGQITSAADPRNMQMGLRLTF